MRSDVRSRKSQVNCGLNRGSNIVHLLIFIKIKCNNDTTHAISGERNKGWQFGENLRTQCSGWFPLAYAEPVLEDSVFSYVYIYLSFRG